MCVRSGQSDFTTAVVKWQLLSAGRDSYLQWRCLCWSWDASMLAIASSCGLVDIYDAVLGTDVCSLPPVSVSEKETASFLVKSASLTIGHVSVTLLVFCSEALLVA